MDDGFLVWQFVSDTCLILPILSDFSAATGVGHYGNGLTVYVISTKLTPVHFGNPRQVHAVDYPREYGPSSPSFARATSLERPYTDHKKLLCVSGTASILGDDTVHICDLTAQLNTTNSNIVYLLEQAGLKGVDIRSLRVYLRHPADAEPARRMVEAWYPDAQIVLTHADICRANLLVEIGCSWLRSNVFVSLRKDLYFCAGRGVT